MSESTPPKVILLDGPLAGFLYNVPPDTYWWNVVVPKQSSIIEMMKEPAKPLLTEHVTYTIRQGRFDASRTRR